MIVSIHQPAYIPWLKYFHKIAKSDIHIFLNDAEYSKNNLFNRNKIKTAQGEMWLTIPIKYKSDNLICETKIDNNSDWGKKHWKTIKLNYAKAPYFKEYANIFEKFYLQNYEYLSDLTIAINKAIAELLEIKVKFIKSSELKVGGTKNEKLINLCKAVDADTYLSGQGAKAYMNKNLFLNNNIKVNYQEFLNPKYKQLWGDFVPDLSIIDFLFNCGKEEIKKYLWKKN